MLALYRSARQAEALEAYQSARRALVDELGIEPSPALQEPERAISADTRLGLPPRPSRRQPPRPKHSYERSTVVAPTDDRNTDLRLALAEPLARAVPPRELIVAGRVAVEELAATARSLHLRCRRAERSVCRPARPDSPRRRRVPTRSARLEQDADLLLLDAPPGSPDDGLVGSQVGVDLGSASCDVGRPWRGKKAFTLDRSAGARPFGGDEHDWAAVELAAWIVAQKRPRFAWSGVRPTSPAVSGTRAVYSPAPRSWSSGRSNRPKRCSWRRARGILRAAAEAGLLVFGLSDRWRQEVSAKRDSRS